MTPTPHRRRRNLCLPLSACLCVAACNTESAAKLDSLNLPDEARAAVARLRFVPLRVGDRVSRGDMILCGPGDRALLAFSRRLMADYFGIDADYLLPELFGRSEGRSSLLPSSPDDQRLHPPKEVFLEVPQRQLMRLNIPPGIGADRSHPQARVREISGTPKLSGDLRAIGLLFTEQEIFARVVGDAPQPVTKDRRSEASPSQKRSSPRRLGISAFPRMGPKSGVVIERVMPGGPAQRAKLGSGDKILAVNGEVVGDLFELIRELEQSHGPLVVLKVRRKKAKSSELVEVFVMSPGTDSP